MQTLTELADYTYKVYLEQGWITEKQYRSYLVSKFVGSCIAVALPVLVLALVGWLAFK